MLRLRFVSKPPEVHDAPDALVARHTRERLGPGALAGGKVAVGPPAHGVDEEIGDVDTTAGAAQRLGPQHVAFV